MNHQESKLQQTCVAWFRAQYPQYAMLLIHPINEGSGHSQTDRRRQGIHKAEGAVAGVPDLLLFMPNRFGRRWKMSDGNYVDAFSWYHGLGIEFKTPKGRQSQSQKDFQELFERAEYAYIIVRSFEEFKDLITNWMDNVPVENKSRIKDAYSKVEQAAEQREREKFYKVIGKK